MKPVLDDIVQARQAEGWNFERWDTEANGSGFIGTEAGGRTLWVGPDGVIYEGLVTDQAMVGLVSGTVLPSQTAGLNPVR